MQTLRLFVVFEYEETLEKNGFPKDDVVLLYIHNDTAVKNKMVPPCMPFKLCFSLPQDQGMTTRACHAWLSKSSPLPRESDAKPSSNAECVSTCGDIPCPLKMPGENERERGRERRGRARCW